MEHLAPPPSSSQVRPAWKDVCAIARAHAEAVDREGRFPAEAVDALKAYGAFSLGVPTALGGGGAGTATLARMARDLGGACASTAMVFAMHHNQLACLVRHSGDTPWLLAFQRQVAAEELLLASVTSEEGTGGRLRTSQCCVEPLYAEGLETTCAQTFNDELPILRIIVDNHDDIFDAVALDRGFECLFVVGLPPQERLNRA